MTTTQPATDDELQHMAENFHGTRLDFDKISFSLKHFVNVCHKPKYSTPLTEEWKTVEDRYISQMAKSDDTAVKLHARLSILMEYFDQLESSGSKDIQLHHYYDSQEFGDFTKNATELAVAFSKTYNADSNLGFRGPVEGMKGSIDWFINSYTQSMLQSEYDEIKDVIKQIRQEYTEAFLSLLKRLTAIESVWLRLKEDSTTLRKKMILVGLKHASNEFDAKRKEAYSLVLKMHNTLQAYISAASSPDNVPDENIDK